ncbi:MAG: PQQ-like beta-propeller repeat protein, partial [bacterium]|nr:PQQ-like beta-propeller repeat protein [bacterium]
MKRFNRVILIVVVIVIAVLFSCDSAVGPSDLICNPYPADRATGVPCNVQLRWYQPEDCKMTEVYFAIAGTNWQPVEVSQPGRYDPGILNAYTEYRWKIVTYGKDLEGPEWAFTTGDRSEEDENVLWRFRTGDRVHSDPVVADGRVFFGSNDEVIYCLSAETGAPEWVFATDDSNSGGFVYDSGRVYCAAGFNDIGCFDGDTGLPIWHEGYMGNFSGFTPFLYEEKIFIGTKRQYVGYDSYFFCLDAEDGRPIWHFFLPKTVSSDAYVADGKTFFGCSNDALYCVDADTGDEIWVLKN